jgi:very-short-patch-repair endonuclease
MEFVKRVLAPLLSMNGLARIAPQHPVEKYFVDFAVAGATNIAIEVDGFGKFETSTDLNDFSNRQNILVINGWRPIRFTYRDIMDNTDVTRRRLYDLLRADSVLRDYLEVQDRQPTLFPESTNTPDGLDVIQLVNSFYLVQDFVAWKLSEGESQSRHVSFQDDFQNLPRTFVATAISSLFDFLDAVEQVVDVSFDLPEITIAGDRTIESGNDCLNRRVQLFSGRCDGAVSISPSVLGAGVAGIPCPPLVNGPVKLREAANLDILSGKLRFFARTLFGFGETRDFQNRVFARVFRGEDVLGISATGSGKSLCYWLPALLRPGLTLVVSPLKSLMRDQRLTLRNCGIASAEYINADVRREEQERILHDAKLGYIRLLYVAPERLRIRRFCEEMKSLSATVPVNFLAVDEAHCLSEWGHDFRPSYLKIRSVRKWLNGDSVQLIALTATAGPVVKHDMLRMLGMDTHDVVEAATADRTNFSYRFVCVESASDKAKSYVRIMNDELASALRHDSLHWVADKSLCVHHHRGYAVGNRGSRMRVSINAKNETYRLVVKFVL